MPSPGTFKQEIELWKETWSSVEVKPCILPSSLEDNRACIMMFPNIVTILHLTLLTSVTATGVERPNSSLKFIKTAFRNSIGEEKLKALVLLSQRLTPKLK